MDIVSTVSPYCAARARMATQSPSWTNQSRSCCLRLSSTRFRLFRQHCTVGESGDAARWIVSQSTARAANLLHGNTRLRSNRRLPAAPRLCKRRLIPLADMPPLFAAEIQQFSTSVHGVVSGLSEQAAVIEGAKLKARAMARREGSASAHALALVSPPSLFLYLCCTRTASDCPRMLQMLAGDRRALARRG